MTEMACMPAQRRAVPPGAMQVADRWHIAHNLADALERMAVRVLVQLHKQRAVDDLAGQEQRAPPAIPGPVL